MNSRYDCRAKYERLRDQGTQAGWHVCCWDLAPQGRLATSTSCGSWTCFSLAPRVWNSEDSAAIPQAEAGRAWRCPTSRSEGAEPPRLGLELWTRWPEPSWVQSSPGWGPRTALSPSPRLRGSKLGWSETEPGSQAWVKQCGQGGPRAGAASLTQQCPWIQSFHFGEHSSVLMYYFLKTKTQRAQSFAKRWHLAK